MATSNDHPELPFIQAQGFTDGRPDGPPLWHVIHDMEANETFDRGYRTARYFENPGDGRRVSSHYSLGGTFGGGLYQCVDLDDSAWTVGNRPGNNRGINWELAGFASQSRAAWLDAYGRAMFARMAPIFRADCARFGIPIRRLTIAELRAFKPGVTSHNDLGVAFGGTDHTDPGSQFPWDVFLETMQGIEQEEHMAFMFSVMGDPQLWISNHITRRALPGATPTASPIYSMSVAGGAKMLGELNPGTETPDVYATKLGGPIDPGASCGGDGITEEESRAIAVEVVESTNLTVPDPV